MSRIASISCGVVAAAVWSWVAMAPEAYTADPLASLATRELITNFQESPAGVSSPTVLTIVEPQSRVLAVYHIMPATGEIKLKSVRNFEMDLRLVDFNGGDPKPDEIRKMFERQP